MNGIVIRIKLLRNVVVMDHLGKVPVVVHGLKSDQMAQ